MPKNNSQRHSTVHRRGEMRCSWQKPNECYGGNLIAAQMACLKNHAASVCFTESSQSTGLVAFLILGIRQPPPLLFRSGLIRLPLLVKQA